MKWGRMGPIFPAFSVWRGSGKAGLKYHHYPASLFPGRRLRLPNGEWWCWMKVAAQRRWKKDCGNALILSLLWDGCVSNCQLSIQALPLYASVSFPVKWVQWSVILHSTSIYLVKVKWPKVLAFSIARNVAGFQYVKKEAFKIKKLYP